MLQTLDTVPMSLSMCMCVCVDVCVCVSTHGLIINIWHPACESLTKYNIYFTVILSCTTFPMSLIWFSKMGISHLINLHWLLNWINWCSNSICLLLTNWQVFLPSAAEKILYVMETIYFLYKSLLIFKSSTLYCLTHNLSWIF